MDKRKIGYSQFGGLFVGSGVNSAFHKHDYIVAIFSLRTIFKLAIKNSRTDIDTEGILINRNIEYRLSTPSNDRTVFIHIDPYSSIGISLQGLQANYIELQRNEFEHQINQIENWYAQDASNQKEIEMILNSFADKLATKYDIARKVDERILKCLHIMSEAEEGSYNLDYIASLAGLSSSRFSHLFKAETGCTFRDFMKNRKLSKAIGTLVQKSNLTAAAFDGGFADQPHFTNTFKRTFGIKPSESKDS
ncbi:MAG: helix-turn-helix domain-containing protein [Chloroflexota bacterium]|nr:helix-turn-helix domain-containing protein [Anaerolineales bacterium]